MCLQSQRKAVRDRRHFAKQNATAMSTASLDENRRLWTLRITDGTDKSVVSLIGSKSPGPLVKTSEHKLTQFSVKNVKLYSLTTHYKIAAITAILDSLELHLCWVSTLKQHVTQCVCYLFVCISPQEYSPRKTSSFACLDLFPGPDPEQNLKCLLVEWRSEQGFFS